MVLLVGEADQRAVAEARQPLRRAGVALVASTAPPLPGVEKGGPLQTAPLNGSAEHLVQAGTTAPSRRRRG